MAKSKTKILTSKQIATRAMEKQGTALGRNYRSDSFGWGGGGGSGNAFAGSQKNIQNEKWSLTRDTPDHELKYGTLQELRKRSNQLIKDNAIAEGTVLAFQEMAVGEGPMITSQVEDANVRDIIQNEVIEPMMEKWDASGERSITQYLKAIVGNVLASGDVLNLALNDPSREGIQTCFDLVEADRIATPNDDSSSRIRHGVEYDENNRVVGYWVKKIGQSEADNKFNQSNFNLSRYPKIKNGRLSAWLLKRPEAFERPGSSRQIPLFSSCIQILKDMDALLEASVIGQRVAACLMAAITSEDPEGMANAFTEETQKGGASKGRLEDKHGRPYSRFQPGMMIPLRIGEEIKMLDPKRSGQEVVPMLLHGCNILSMKLRFPFQLLFLDFANMNYSSYRGSILEVRKLFKGFRKWLQIQMIWPGIQLGIQEAFLMGKIPVPKLTKEILYPRIQWPSWGNVDPTKEVQANRDAIGALLTSHTRTAAEAGEDAYQIVVEEAKFLKHVKEMELEHGVKIPIFLGQGGAPAQPGADNAEAQPGPAVKEVPKKVVPVDDQADEQTDDETPTEE